MVRFFLCIFFSFLFYSSLSQTVRVGLRENSYAQLICQTNNKNIKLIKKDFLHQYCLGSAIEHSIFPETHGYQYIRLYGIYKNKLSNCETAIAPYIGGTYNGMFWNSGLMASISYSIANRLDLWGIVNPFYDSGLKKTFAYRCGGDIRLFRLVYLTLQYGTIPEYRDLESRYRMGFKVKDGDLMVNPEISFKMPWNTRNIRMLVSFTYDINNKTDEKNRNI